MPFSLAQRISSTLQVCHSACAELEGGNAHCAMRMGYGRGTRMDCGAVNRRSGGLEEDCLKVHKHEIILIYFFT